ncbi:MAG: Xanthine dehydrogenase iron-sulfur subunit / Xanthine dehydrogenase, FAD binding subunit [uncultured Ramlibacter sp.]|uniref:Xanthine dehydrogenase iron-sulfur subunit / Xanthine dehydrogenase, FAD binding subunit n=1 Tax=uncultured Ramlibacter sp. TaxID=260755 RepID=A0A6J4P5N7_9BURK|nr:MAG: Xanthine dehydrogenase iron-sulfur subunit / Xanthine dehydrogenase, FAD binding subunit [uncultured Ramlibacter sp.]
MDTKTIRFLRRGELVSLGNVPPDRTLLEVLREDLGATGTKEGCGEGDCGACTVVLGEPQGDGLSFRAVNSCIRLAHSVDGLAVWTVEDLVSDDGRLHPAQEAMVQCHGSQCGFCTPGFVMSLFGMYQNHVCKGRTITRGLAQEELSGNLCRCTGYRPILDAAQQMAQLPAVPVDEAAVAAKLKQLAAPAAPEYGRYLAPGTLRDLLAARAANPGAQVVAGCTDVGLWVTKQHRQFAQVLDVTRARELRRIEDYEHHIAIGAAVSLTDAYAALVAQRPQLKTFANRFAGLPVRNAGTLGGNVANGSPIGDSMPLLIALDAQVVLMSSGGHRHLPLEAFYTGYRQTVLAPDELLAWVLVPKPRAAEFLRAYKISKRYDDDISAVCLVIRLELEDGRVARVGIGAGGVAATPVRAQRTERFLAGKPWTVQTAQEAARVLRAEFQPISDMRASAAYRSEVLGNLLQRFWLESQGANDINLEQFELREAAT